MYCSPDGVVSTPFCERLAARNAAPSLRFFSPAAPCWRAMNACRVDIASCSVISGAPLLPRLVRTACISTATSISSFSGSSEGPIMRSPTSRPTCSFDGAGGSPPGGTPGTRWPDRTATAVCSAVLPNVKDGSIILMHDGYRATVEALRRIVKELKEEGYTFVTVRELIEE